MNIYTAEGVGGDLYLIAGWVGLDQPGFKEFVLDQLERDGIPEPDRNISQLSLCEWEEETLGLFFTMSEDSTAAWKHANFATLYWTYPGVWSETNVTRMPPELAAVSWDGEGVDRSDPKHPDWHSTHADIWDNREKGAS